MTGLVFSPTPENQNLRQFGHDSLPATLGETLSATVADPTLRLSQLLATQLEIIRETGINEPRRVTARGQTFVQLPDPSLSPLVSPEELNAEFGHTGARFEEPTRRRVAEIIAEQKLEERIRQDVLRRGPEGFVAGAARFGVAFLGAAVDPLSVAASFIPVVGQARYAGLVARLGATGARVSKGVVEGVVGNALIESGVFLLSREQQLDYEASDALLNVALGGLLGGGLHATGGALGDAFVRLRPQTREAALRAAVAQMAQGRRVDVLAILRQERDELGRAFDQVLREPIGAIDDPLVRLRPEVIEDVLVERGPAFLKGEDIIVRGREIGRLFGSKAGFGLAKIIFRHGPRSSKAERFRITKEDVLALPEVLRDFEPSRVLRDEAGEIVGRNFRVSLPNDRFGPRDVVFGVRKFTDGDGENRLVTAFVVDPDIGVETPKSQRRTGGGAGSPDLGFKPEAGDTAAGAFDRPSQGQAPSPASENLGPLGDDFNEAARREGRADRDAMADFEAARLVDEELHQRSSNAAGEASDGLGETTAKAEADFIESQIRELRAQNAHSHEGLGEDVGLELQTSADLTSRAEAYGRALRAAALCLENRP